MLIEGQAVKVRKRKWFPEIFSKSWKVERWYAIMISTFKVPAVIPEI